MTQGHRTQDKILLSHGSGGKLTHELIDSVFIKAFNNKTLAEKKDSGIATIGKRKIAFTTDSYVVKPIFFPGGDIGSLAVSGTVNDLAVCGAIPLAISMGVIIEEGLDADILKRVVLSAHKTAERAGVKIITGDTKVVEKGSCDKLFINTSGIGEVIYDRLSINSIKKGDAVLVNGPIGDHAISVLSQREGIGFKSTVKSDAAPLNRLISGIFKTDPRIRFMRDPTRGGIATTLNEIVERGRFGIVMNEERIPVRAGVREACELLGLDPLYLACEGRVIVICDRMAADNILSSMRQSPIGKGACVIGHVDTGYRGRVVLEGASGGRRIVDMLSGEQLPRIC